MRTNFDLTPFRRATVGFDRLFDMLGNGMTNQTGGSDPPFDLGQQGNGDDEQRVVGQRGNRLAGDEQIKAARHSCFSSADAARRHDFMHGRRCSQGAVTPA